MPRKVTFQVDADTKGVQKGLSDTEKATNKLHGALDRFGPVGSGVANILGKLGFSSVGAAAGVAGAAVAVGAAVKIAEDAINQYTTLGDAVRRYSQITGQSAEDSTRQVFAFKELGVDADTVAAAMFKLARAADNAKDPLGAVGVNVARDASGVVDLNATLLNVIQAWQGTTDASRQAAIVFAAFGKAGTTMLPILETNSAELKRLESQVQLLYTAKDLESIRQYTVAQNELKQSNDDLGLSIGRALLPAQTALVEGINEDIYVNEHLSQSTEYQTAVAHNNRAATMKVAEALRQQYKDSLAARDAQTQLAESMKQEAAATQAEAAAEDALYDSIHKNLDAGFAYQQSLIDLSNAENAYTAAKGKGAEVNLQLRESLVKVADAAVAQAEAQAEANGTTLSAADKAQIFRDKLRELEKGIDKNSPLYKDLEAYIAELNAIPSEKTTSLHLKFQGINARAGGNVAQYADGGMVPGPSGSPQLAVVHGGEEVIPVGGRGGRDVHYHFHIDGLYADGPGLDKFTNAIAQRLRMVTGI